MPAAGLLRQAVVQLGNLLLPPACASCLCRLDPPDPDRFCSACRQQIPRLSVHRCSRCALPFAEGSGSHLCRACLQEKGKSFDQVSAVGSYDELLRELIQRFKYRGDINLDRPLATLLSSQISPGTPPPLIVPVPLHRNKQRQRGYNQSELLARRLARLTGSTMASDLLTRVRDDGSQQGLSAADRAKNIRHAFVVKREISGHVLLIDDVMTTGATVRECSRQLLGAGADQVEVLVLARARQH